MKIKLDFVTNSSSNAFIFIGFNKIRRKDINLRHVPYDRFKLFTNKKQLITYCKGAPPDWIEIIRGEPTAKYYEHMHQGLLEKVKDGLKKAPFVAYLHLDRDKHDREKVRDIMYDLGYEVFHVESF
jgi:hypothetical protein